jgi:gliding motility-associated-like protein
VSTSSTYNTYVETQDSTLITIKLKTKNAGFCYPDSISKTIFTPNKPIASFSLSDTSNCAPFETNITNTSQGAVSYNWNLGNTNSSSLFEPTALYQASLVKDTQYNISLITTNWANCKDTVDLDVTVYPKPSVQFTMDKSAGCGPLGINFTNTSSPNDTGSIQIMSFDWDLGNGSKSSAINSSGFYIASLITDSIYTIKLTGITEHQCKDSIEKNITVYPKPIAIFNPSLDKGCAPLSIDFVNKSIPNDTGSITDMSFNWSINGNTFTSVNPNSVFVASNNKDTIHQVKLIALSEHNCADTITKDILVYPKPVASFNINLPAGCTPHAVNLNNTSTPNDTGSIQIMSFNWNLGDGSSTSAVNPSKAYVNYGNTDSNYYISLIAKSEHGCADTTDNSVTVHPKPVVDFDQDKNSGCGPLTVNFTEKSINGSEYYWNFGKAWVSAKPNEQRTFEPIALFDTIYNVLFTTSSIHNCMGDTISKPVQVLGTPKAEFLLSKDTSCNEESTLFYNTSLAAIRYEWDFGDNTTSKLINPTKTFKADNQNDKAITYPIKLTATSVFGCKDTITKFFTAAPLPKAEVAFDKLNGCGDLNIQFTNASTNSTSQKWNFGEGSTSTVKNPNFTYTNNTPASKSYLVTLETFASAGCNAIDTTTVTVFPKPFFSVQATRTNICDSGNFGFISNGSSINTINWEFNDGSPSQTSAQSAQPFTHYFPQSTYTDTSFNVKITAISSKGCSDSLFKTVALNAKVIADFDQTPNSACVPAAADFTNKSRNATNYVWEFGDGGGSGDKNPSYIYNKPGTYSVKLTAFDVNGCRSIKYGNNNFVARETPIAEFVMNPGQLKLPDAKATFNNLSIYSAPTQFEWDFGDGTPTSPAINPVHVYADTGAFKVRLLAKNNSCQDVIIKQIIVDPSLPIANFDPGGAVGCAPLGVQFNEKTQYAEKFTWHFGDGNSSKQANPFHVYQNEGFYTVTLIVEGPGGSSKIVKSNIIEVKKTPRVYFYATPDTAHLPNARFDMDNQSINANTYSWELNKSDNQQLVGTSTLKNPSFIINEVGNYDVTLMATNTNLCHDSLTKPLLLIVLEQGHIYVPTGFTPNRDNINDVFKPVMLGVNETDYTFRIFDRWGEKIFETRDKKAGWDGTIRQDKVAENVFVWTISGKFADGTYFNKKGTVTLLR